MSTYLIELQKLYKKNGLVTQEWADMVSKKTRAMWEERIKKGKLNPIELSFFDSEAFGEKCPVCSKVPDPIDQPVIYRGDKDGDNRMMGVYRRYELNCNCWDNYDNRMKEENNYKIRLKDALIPEKYKNLTWNNWDMSVSKELTDSFNWVKSQISDENIGKFLKSFGLCLYGENGRGKSMVGICVLKTLLFKTKLKCRYISMSDYIQQILRRGPDSEYQYDIEDFDVLYLDDLDKLKNTDSEWVKERIFSLYDRMYRDSKILIMSTNLMTPVDIINYFKEFGSVGNAISSRLSEGMVFGRFIGGEDYRTKIRAKNGLKNHV